jgi:hypothetical protein
LAIVGPLMLAAAFEWILWLAAFLYCLIKVYLKADHWSIKSLAAVMMVLFTMFRYAYLDQCEFQLAEGDEIADNTNTLQAGISSGDGRDAATATSNHSAFPYSHVGDIPVVCFLVILHFAYRTIALLRIRTRHKSHRKEKENQRCLG